MAKNKITAGAVLALATPLLVFAAQIDNLLTNIRATLNYIIAILFVLVTLFFIWGVVQYVASGGDETKLKNGKQHMIWGLIGMIVMGAAWGIARIVWDYFGITGGATPPIPNI
ncbi:MAG: hypothetical protein PHW33_00630 [Candidatus Portnoybacteria bacterium]|jgi:protein-S-isoprenylcysteine O-methyltransferase Ste14|nr:hypothetical protein [Candidatus Portnoybacteria bacterium]